METVIRGEGGVGCIYTRRVKEVMNRYVYTHI